MAPGGGGRVKTSHDGDLPGEVRALGRVYSLGPCGGRPRGSSLLLRSTGPVHAAPRPHGSPLPPACPLRLYFQTGLFTLPQNHPSKGCESTGRCPSEAPWAGPCPLFGFGAPSRASVIPSGSPPTPGQGPQSKLYKDKPDQVVFPALKPSRAPR